MSWDGPEGRFWAKVQRSDDPAACWMWTGATKGNGYGHFYVVDRKVLVHRWAYEHLVGEIPDGFEVDHRCHDSTCTAGAACLHRACVNPAHLEAVTLQVNRARAKAAKVRCSRGHTYSTESTRWQVGPKGYVGRVCRICERARHARYRAATAP